MSREEFIKSDELYKVKTFRTTHFGFLANLFYDNRYHQISWQTWQSRVALY